MVGIGRLLSLRKTVFICHASEDKVLAEDLALRLRRRRFNVFFDRDVLEPGESYDDRIRREIGRSDALIFLVSPDSIRDGKYTRSELKHAHEQWPDPHGRVLPAMVRPTEVKQIPSYLRAVTILEPQGDIVAETAAAVEKLTGGSIRWLPVSVLSTAGIATAVALAWFAMHKPPDGEASTDPIKRVDLKVTDPPPISEPPVLKPVQFPASFHFMFTLEPTDPNPNLNKELARLYVPARRLDRKIARQSDGFYDEILDTPDAATLFSATVVRDIVTGYVGTAPRTSFCLRRRDDAPGDVGKNHVMLRCKEGDQPCDTMDAADEGLLGPAVCGPKRAGRNGSALRRLALAPLQLVSQAHAQGSSQGASQDAPQGASYVWSVPSLESLLERRNTRDLRDGFTTFTLRSPAGIAADADGIGIDLAVDDTPVLIGGVPVDLRVVPFERGRPFELKFALQNLNFNGRYAGCDHIDVKLVFSKQGEPADPVIPLQLRYAALRDVANTNIATDYGPITWTAKYEVARGANAAGTDWRVFVRSARPSQIGQLQQVQKEIDQLGLVYRDGDRPTKVVAVLRPPLVNSAGIALGLLQDTGQIRFTFTQGEAERLKGFVVQQQAQNSQARRLFEGVPDLYQEPPGANRQYSCSSSR
jgi:hypothetical protein